MANLKCSVCGCDDLQWVNIEAGKDVFFCGCCNGYTELPVEALDVDQPDFDSRGDGRMIPDWLTKPSRGDF